MDDIGAFYLSAQVDDISSSPTGMWVDAVLGALLSTFVHSAAIHPTIDDILVIH